jgi:hypothetical protein
MTHLHAAMTQASASALRMPVGLARRSARARKAHAAQLCHKLGLLRPNTPKATNRIRHPAHAIAMRAAAQSMDRRAETLGPRRLQLPSCSWGGGKHFIGRTPPRQLTHALRGIA